MTLFRRVPRDPEVARAEATGDSVRAQVSLLAWQIHKEFEKLERVLAGEIDHDEGATGDRPL